MIYSKMTNIIMTIYAKMLGITTLSIKKVIIIILSTMRHSKTTQHYNIKYNNTQKTQHKE
jgi:hypothetical protein